MSARCTCNVQHFKAGTEIYVRKLIFPKPRPLRRAHPVWVTGGASDSVENESIRSHNQLSHLTPESRQHQQVKLLIFKNGQCTKEQADNENDINFVLYTFVNLLTCFRGFFVFVFVFVCLFVCFFFFFLGGGGVFVNYARLILFRNTTTNKCIIRKHILAGFRGRGFATHPTPLEGNFSIKCHFCHF